SGHGWGKGAHRLGAGHERGGGAGARLRGLFPHPFRRDAPSERHRGAREDQGMSDRPEHSGWVPEGATPVVGILCGSSSDLPVIEQVGVVLEGFEIPHELRVISAHRNPEDVDEYARTADERGLVVIIAAAGMANHLAGAVAARTMLPVIGVPLSGSKLDGVDALYSTVM